MLSCTSAEDLAEAAAPDAPTVGAEELRLAIFGRAEDIADEQTRALAQRAVKRLNETLADASAIVNSHLGTYRPADDAHARILKVRTCDIALYRLYRPEEDKDRVSAITTNYKTTMTWLRDVGAGNLLLDPNPHPNTSLIDAPKRCFTRDTLRAFLGRK